MIIKRFHFNFINSDFLKAAKIAEDLLVEDSIMMTDLKYKSDWKYKPIFYGNYLVYTLCGKREPILVTTYKPFYFRSKVIGYFDGKAIYFNHYKLKNLSVINITGTLLHEYSHYCGFSHGNNFKTQDKVRYSVPYYISENIELWVKDR